jgi:hypothetical protein
MKEVKIETLADMIKIITPENADEMVKNMSVWIRMIVLAKATGVDEALQPFVIWRDDGKPGISEVRIHIQEPENEL